MEADRRLDGIIRSLRDLNNDLEQIVLLGNDMEYLDTSVRRLASCDRHWKR